MRSDAFHAPTCYGLRLKADRCSTGAGPIFLPNFVIEQTKIKGAVPSARASRLRPQSVRRNTPSTGINTSFVCNDGGSWQLRLPREARRKRYRRQESALIASGARLQLKVDRGKLTPPRSGHASSSKTITALIVDSPRDELGSPESLMADSMHAHHRAYYARIRCSGAELAGARGVVYACADGRQHARRPFSRHCQAIV